MQSELTLKLKPDFDDLSKAINRVTRATGANLTNTLSDSIKKATSNLNTNLSLRNIFSKEVGELNKRKAHLGTPLTPLAQSLTLDLSTPIALLKHLHLTSLAFKYENILNYK
ncbi:hypothetical protein [Helicobacter sp. 11S02629-2]|uniref:hypothetical protein n=1 Tax=Helicobacter sp. 11S02629-2 TaxID=1476195 RepID=UPI000BA6001A|nr:hypothetical protein [Helicobacter sp. 11S02629-2]PAF45373.1 hypothetical protein BKH40_04075 [Helicobacter sp. 11S02629-2]